MTGLRAVVPLVRGIGMKNLEYYSNLPYTVIVRRDEDGDYVARIDELPGCSTQGENPQVALENLKEVQKAWIEDCIEQRDPVPEPEPTEPLPSGKWLQRV